MKKLLKKFNIIKDESGVASTEFALLAPMIITMMVGIIETTNYLTVERRAEMSNNSMSQVLSHIGQYGAWSVHHAQQIPAYINPTQDFPYGWGGDSWDPNKSWRLPFAFSQIVFEQVNPSCTSNCAMRPSRDFMYAYPRRQYGMVRACRVMLVNNASTARNSLALPRQYLNQGTPVLMVAHTAQYKPIIASWFGDKLSRFGTFEIRKITYASRYDGEVWSWPSNHSDTRFDNLANYRYCNGPGT